MRKGLVEKAESESRKGLEEWGGGGGGEEEEEEEREVTEMN